MPATITATFRKTDGQPLQSAQVVVTRTRLNPSDPVSNLRLLRTTNASGQISVDLEAGSYDIVLPSTGDELRANVPASSGSFNLSTILV